MTATYDSLNDLWEAAVRLLKRDGTLQESRNGPTREVVGWSGRLSPLGVRKNVLLSGVRKADPCFAGAELLWYLTGGHTAEFMCHYAPQYARFANPPEPRGDVWGAYGRRWCENPGFAGHLQRESEQLYAAMILLRKKPDTRQAVVTMWDSGDLPEAVFGNKNDLPCTVCLQFLLRKNRLHCVAYMRSNDVWLGMPYDVHNFTNVQKLMARRLNAGLGSYTHCVGSLHAYEKDVPKIEDDLDMRRPQADDYLMDKRPWPSVKPAMAFAEACRVPGGVTVKEYVAWAGEWGGNPIGDAALACAAKWVPWRPIIIGNPSMAQAWAIRYGGKDAAH